MLAVNLLNYTVQNSFSVNTSNVVPPLLHRYLYIVIIKMLETSS